ncbi:MAG: hypothetical protein ACI4VL_03020 [Bacilli bacterium]
MEENREQKKMNGPLIYAIVGVAVLIVAVAGSAYAYYAATATGNISGTAAGAGLSLTVNKVSTGASGNLIPIDADTTTLTNAAKGWTGSAIGTSWNASYACKDKNGYSVCQIYEVKLTNSSSVAMNFNIGVTALSGTNTPNIDVVKMASNISVTDVTSIKGSATGIANNVTVSANGTSSTYYIMVFIKNLDTAQTDNGAFSGTVTAISTTGDQVKANFG